MENQQQSQTTTDQNPPQKLKVHYCKENVYIFPSSKEGIPGYFYIVEKFFPNHESFLAWTPYYMLQSNENKLPSPTDLYALQVSLKEIRSIKRYIPSIGIPHITIVTESGVALTPYYFYSGGVREFFNVLKQHVNVSRSSEDPSIFYLRDPSQDPSLVLRSSFEKPQIPSVPVQPPTSVTTSPTTPPSQPQAQPSVIPAPNVLPPPPPPKQADNLAWAILENFSKVTKFARSAAHGTLLKEIDQSISQAIENLDTVLGKPLSSNKDKEESSFSSVSHSTTLGAFEVIDNAPSQSIPKVERAKELSAEEWISYFDKDGRINNEAEVKKRIFYGGIDPSIREEVWKYLTNLYPWNSTYEERQKILDEKVAKYKKWKEMWQMIDKDFEGHWNKFNNRCQNIDKDVVRTDRTLPFYAGEENANLKMLNDILTTYIYFNFDLGYVQGMNELLSPILFVMQDEATAFWCFKGIMDFKESNFHKDQIGMHTQLVQLSKLVKALDQGLYDYLQEKDCLNMFFCFRWIIILFKREFSFNTIQRLWEVLWTNYLTPNFHLFIALAILLKHKNKIVEEEMKFDEIVKYMNELAGTMNMEELLVQAETLYLTFLRATATTPELRDEILTKRV